MSFTGPQRLFAVLCVLAAAIDARASGCPGTPQQSPGPDVIVGVVSQDAISNYGSDGGYEAFSVGTTSCNLGNQPLSWQSSGVNHPVISQNLFRMKQVNGSRRFEQLGYSWLKHGFFALSQNACCSTCNGTDGSTLGVGCSDPYTSSRNGGQSSLGPKWAVNATTGQHTHVSSPGFSGSVARRLRVAISDLEVSNGSGDVNATRYFVECQYIAADDAASGNKNNNASYRPLSVSGSGSAWSFTAIGSTQREQAGIRAWKDTDPTVSEADVVTAEDGGMSALVILAAQATDLGGGMWHYEYAVQNLNSDRGIGGFWVPVRPDAVISNIGFRDVDYHDGDGPGGVNYDGTDWPGTTGSARVSWSTTDFGTNQNANAIRWGMMYNFRFDANVAPWPGKGTVNLAYFKPGVGTEATAQVITPDPCIRGDVNLDGFVDGLDIELFVERLISGGSSFQELCAGDLEMTRDGIINVDDMPNFADCLLTGGCG